MRIGHEGGLTHERLGKLPIVHNEFVEANWWTAV